MTKDKRQKRFQQKKRHILRQFDIWNRYSLVDAEREPHRFHKKSALNCGNPSCVWCMNPRKAFGEKTFQERRFECMEMEYE